MCVCVCGGGGGRVGGGGDEGAVHVTSCKFFPNKTAFKPSG